MPKTYLVGRLSDLSAPRRGRRTLTPINAVTKSPTFTAPVSAPGATSRPETWDAHSRDGLWHYQRQDDGTRTPWVVALIPTGQVHSGEYAKLSDARAATAAGLLNTLRGQAYELALRSPLEDPGRADGHRWLAIHMRLAGVGAGADADHRCHCGGYLVVATRNGDLAHVDVCPRCYQWGEGVAGKDCSHAGEHRFCGHPAPAGVAAGCGLYRFDCCPGECFRQQ